MSLGSAVPARGIRVRDVILHGAEPPPPLFGAGLGMFIAPNNSATIGAAPASLSGEAGALLNLMRVLGTSLGVVSASSMLSWRMQVRMGVRTSAVLFTPDQLIDALEHSLAMLAVFALIAAAASLVRNRRPA